MMILNTGGIMKTKMFIPLLTLLSVCSPLSFAHVVSAAAVRESNTNQQVITSAVIPDELTMIPEGYESEADQQGTIEKLTYKTYESMTYDQKKQELTKNAYVYLPYGYSDEKQYNVFYLMQGGWSDETTMLGTDVSPNTLKNVIDHAVEDKKMQLIIIVCPTYNNTSDQDSADYELAIQLTDNYHNELVNDLIPAVEDKYSPFAENTSPSGLLASRDHRGFGGFSMGSVTTWHTFQYCLDYFRYFMPMSGNLTLDGNFMDDIVKNSGWTSKDFFIYAMSGTDDFAYSAFAYQLAAMLSVIDGNFIEANKEANGNLAFRVQEGGTHTAEYASQYIYNGLCWFWNE